MAARTKMISRTMIAAKARMAHRNPAPGRRHGKSDPRADQGFVRPGLAAVILLAAVIGLLVAAPETFLPDWPPQPQRPETSPVESGPDSLVDPITQPVDPNGGEFEAAEENGPLDDLWDDVRRQWDKAWEILQAPGSSGGQAPGIVPFDSGAEQVLPAMDLGVALRTADGVARWRRLTARYPELRDLDPVMVKARLMGVWPTRHLMAVGAEAETLEEFCHELNIGGTPCTAVRVEADRIAGGLNRRPLMSVPPHNHDQESRAVKGATPPLPEAVIVEATFGNEALRAEDSGASFQAGGPATLQFRVGEIPDSMRRVRIVAVGDVMLGSDYPDGTRLNPALPRGAGADAVLEPELLTLLRGADLTFANLEGAMGRDGMPAKDCERCYSFRSPPHYAQVLADAGVDAVSLANNHAGDFGLEGVRSTVSALTKAGIAAAGSAELDGARMARFETASGLQVALLAFAPNRGALDLLDTDAAAAMVRDAARDHDVVVVSAHAGAEGVAASRVARSAETFLGEPRGDIHAFAHAVVAAGADLVIGHGPHVPRAIEVVDGRLIAYSLGNFWTYAGFITWGLLGLGPVLDVTLDENGAVIAFAIHSTRQAGEGRPKLDPRGEAARFVMDRTARDFPRTYARLGRMRLASRL